MNWWRRRGNDRDRAVTTGAASGPAGPGARGSQADRELAAAKRETRDRLRHADAQTPEVERVARSLRAATERNHLAERLRLAMQGRYEGS